MGGVWRCSIKKKKWDIKRKERDRGGVGMVIPKFWTTTIGYHWDWVISWAKKHMSIFKPWIVSRLKVKCFSYNLNCWQLCVFFFVYFILIIRRCSYVQEASNTLVVNRSQNNKKMGNHQSCNKVCVMISYAMLVHTWWSSMFYLKKTRILLFLMQVYCMVWKKMIFF